MAITSSLSVRNVLKTPFFFLSRERHLKTNPTQKILLIYQRKRLLERLGGPGQWAFCPMVTSASLLYEQIRKQHLKQKFSNCLFYVLHSKGLEKYLLIRRSTMSLC